MLDLEENKIGDEGIKAINEAFKINTILTTLHLKHNKIRDEGVKIIG